MWSELQSLPKGEVQPDDPVFLGKKGGHLTPYQVWVIVKNAAGRGPKGSEAVTSRHVKLENLLGKGFPKNLLHL